MDLEHLELLEDRDHPLDQYLLANQDYLAVLGNPDLLSFPDPQESLASHCSLALLWPLSDLEVLVALLDLVNLEDQAGPGVLCLLWDLQLHFPVAQEDLGCL